MVSSTSLTAKVIAVAMAGPAPRYDSSVPAATASNDARILARRCTQSRTTSTEPAAYTAAGARSPNPTPTEPTCSASQFAPATHATSTQSSTRGRAGWPMCAPLPGDAHARSWLTWSACLVVDAALGSCLRLPFAMFQGEAIGT
ncbi:hypothetical protein [Amycolatopsis sp. NPDC004625]|uniref:hypothetical protein n=1 Tax=Amycolatopsis sp. NPDC004625 TaxID=3154670 RepID=UPI0033A2B252